MRKPAESLDDFNLNPALKAAEPPALVSLHFTGEMEILKPLETSGKRGVRISWLQLSLGVGGGIALSALILLSAVLIEISDKNVERASSSMDAAGYSSDQAVEQQPEDTLVEMEVPSSSDSFSASSPSAEDQIISVDSTVRLRRAKSSARLTAHRPLHRSRRMRVVVTEFVPTTLVIYPENGEIKSRIEPQLTAVYKKS